jgi:hypothetical protein
MCPTPALLSRRYVLRTNISAHSIALLVCWGEIRQIPPPFRACGTDYCSPCGVAGNSAKKNANRNRTHAQNNTKGPGGPAPPAAAQGAAVHGQQARVEKWGGSLQAPAGAAHGGRCTTCPSNWLCVHAFASRAGSRSRGGPLAPPTCVHPHAFISRSLASPLVCLPPRART